MSGQINMEQPPGESEREWRERTLQAQLERERHRKTLWIPSREIAYFFVKPGRFHNYLRVTYPDMPEDAEPLPRVWFAGDRDAFAVSFYHPSFPIVEPGAMAPEFIAECEGVTVSNAQPLMEFNPIMLFEANLPPEENDLQRKLLEHSGITYFLVPDLHSFGTDPHRTWMRYNPTPEEIEEKQPKPHPDDDSLRPDQKAAQDRVETVCADIDPFNRQGLKGIPGTIEQKDPPISAEEREARLDHPRPTFTMGDEHDNPHDEEPATKDIRDQTGPDVPHVVEEEIAPGVTLSQPTEEGRRNIMGVAPEDVAR